MSGIVIVCTLAGGAPFFLAEGLACRVEGDAVAAAEAGAATEPLLAAKDGSGPCPLMGGGSLEEEAGVPVAGGGS